MPEKKSGGEVVRLRACSQQTTGGGRQPEEPQVTGRCGYVDDVGVEQHSGGFAASFAAIWSGCGVSSDEIALLMRCDVQMWL